ncbi:MAG TPA: phosphatidylglycerophosphatase A [Erysipelothrix sp.]|nr:phosphatidylglycerophosphatase A [Erysipelothrix sp.]
MRNKCIEALANRGVLLEDMIDLIVFLQRPYMDHINREEVREDLLEILSKREVYFTVMTGIALDVAVDHEEIFDPELQDYLKKDYGLYGVDEVLAYSICNLYGSIALTNFGYIDKVKPGIIGELNKNKAQCNTFLDDIVGALVAAGASKLAHSYRLEESAK